MSPVSSKSSELRRICLFVKVVRNLHFKKIWDFLLIFCMWPLKILSDNCYITTWGQKWLLPWFLKGGHWGPPMGATESDTPWEVGLRGDEFNRNMINIENHGINEIEWRTLKVKLMYSKSKIVKIVESKLQKKMTLFVLFLCQYFLCNLVKYCSNFKFLDNFEQPMETVVEKCPRFLSALQPKKNCQLKSVKRSELQIVGILVSKILDIFGRKSGHF